MTCVVSIEPAVPSNFLQVPKYWSKTSCRSARTADCRCFWNAGCVSLTWVPSLSVTVGTGNSALENWLCKVPGCASTSPVAASTCSPWASSVCGAARSVSSR